MLLDFSSSFAARRWFGLYWEHSSGVVSRRWRIITTWARFLFYVLCSIWCFRTCPMRRRRRTKMGNSQRTVYSIKISRHYLVLLMRWQSNVTWDKITITLILLDDETYFCLKRHVIIFRKRKSNWHGWKKKKSSHTCILLPNGNRTIWMHSSLSLRLQ